MIHQSANLNRSTIGYTYLTIAAIVFLTPCRLALAADTDPSQIRDTAQTGHISKEIELAANYSIGKGVPKDPSLAAYWYQNAAESGNPEAQNEIGYLYQTGAGVPKDLSRAFHWYQLSASSGFLTAKVNLGVAYLWGYGVHKDELLAAQFFRDAADKGSGVAAAYLADLYYFGIGINQDKHLAEHWFEVGERLHDPIAARNLGELFFDIHDHLQDFPKAARLFREAAASGYIPAMYSLGVLLTRHPELASSPQEARNSLKIAANLGSWKSSVILGILARDGNGAPPSPADAFYHFQVAVLQGGEPARHLLANDLAKLAAVLPEDLARNLSANADAWYQENHPAGEFVFKEGGKEMHFPISGLMANDDGVHGAQLLPPPA